MSEHDNVKRRGEQRPGRLEIGIVSAGKVGAALGSALRAAGHHIVGAYASSEASKDRLETMLPGVPALAVEDIVRASELVLFAVPDDELAGIVSGLAKLGAFRPGQMVIHTAGRYGTRVLQPASEAGALALAIHPAMTFTGTSLDVARLAGCPFAVTGPAMYLPIGQALVAEIGGNLVVVGEEDRELYHAALAHGANHLVTVIAQAMRMLEAVGVAEPGEYVRPLAEAALDGALRSGETLLTGPVVRGDAGTVREHLDSLRALAFVDEESAEAYGDIPPAYHMLATVTAQRAHARRVLSDAQYDAVLMALSEEHSPS